MGTSTVIGLMREEQVHAFCDRLRETMLDCVRNGLPLYLERGQDLTEDDGSCLPRILLGWRFHIATVATGSKISESVKQREKQLR